MHSLKRCRNRYYFHTYDSSYKSAQSKLSGTLYQRVTKELRVLAQKSVDTNDSTISIQITQTIQQIESLDSQLEKIETKMMDIMKYNDSVVMTIPAIGYINSGMTLGEIGNIHHFSNSNKLVAFASLDPSVYQSGKLEALLETTQPSKLIMMSSGLKAEHTTIHLVIVPASLPESSGRCSLTM